MPFSRIIGILVGVWLAIVGIYALAPIVFAGRSPSELCRQIKEPKQNGGRSLEKLLDHVGNDDLVGWGWNPGDERALPPLSRAETVEQMKVWVAGGAACP